MPAVLTPTAHPLPPLRADLPTHLDLPDTDGKPVQNTLHPIQTQLLTSCLQPVLDCLHPDGRYFIGEDTGLYYRATQQALEGCKSPDWYYVPDVPPTLDGVLRRSYVMWQEIQSPFVVIEYASRNGVEERDRTPGTGKMWVYERAIRIPYYFIFFPERDVRIEAYRLVTGQYQQLQLEPNGRFPVTELGIQFGLWTGRFRGHNEVWMRAWAEDGFLIPTPQELTAAAETRAEVERKFAESEKQRADAEQQRADAEQQRADAERQRADALAAKLRALGLDPDAP